MTGRDYNFINEWLEEDLLLLPSSETDEIEYKSSRTTPDKLAEKISVAASAFWNSGGGIFIAGINDKSGKIDGGFSEYIGRQPIRDWADRAITKTEPTGPYIIKPIVPSMIPSAIQPDHVVLVIAFGESTAVPHMAHDKTYRIRAGTHSDPAGHFIVEALRARRGLQQPLLRGIFKRSERKWATVEFAVVAATDATALDISLTFEPFPPILKEAFLRGNSLHNPFPLRIPIIDIRHPFVMDMSPFYSKETLGQDPFTIVLQYKDSVGRTFMERQILDPHRSFEPLQIGKEDGRQIKEAIDKVAKHLQGIEQGLANPTPPLITDEE
jgi:hypothetical protein